MAIGDELTTLQRRDRAVERLDAGHLALRRSLEGLEIEDAFLGARWSVREVLLHLDSENFIDALEKIASGDQEMLPPFSSREDQWKKEIDHLEETHRRLRSLVLGLGEDQLARPVTPPNPGNAFPGLTMLELIERVSGHESAHARQIEDTRKYNAAFNSRERAVNIVGLGDGDPERVPPQTRDLLNYADYVAGPPAALEVVRRWVRGVEVAQNEGNTDETVSRMAREARAGLWTAVCVLGDPGEDDPMVALARKYADAVAIHPPIH